MSSKPRPRRAALPSRKSVVREFDLRPEAERPGGAPATAAGAAAAAAAAPAPSQRYRDLRTTQVDVYDPPVTAAAAAAPAPAAPPSDSFGGTARKAAKISIARAKVETFDDLRLLIKSLPSIRTMATTHDPKIGTGATSGRAKEERRNVRVRAWIYAASREDDNDFHLIVGRSPESARMFMTMEVSGLPPASSPHREKLEQIRDGYKSFFQHADAGLPGLSYDFYKPPVPVEIAGSLFFDVSHAAPGSRPGPKDLRPDMPTVWEVHPVTSIKFEP